MSSVTSSAKYAIIGIISLMITVGAYAETTPAIGGAPIVLADQGYFFVGGKFVESAGRKLMADQMYVEYMTPVTVTHPYPIVMIHGTAQTGTNFTGTPDGRRGWAHDFLARGYRVYIVDQSGAADPASHRRFTALTCAFLRTERSLSSQRRRSTSYGRRQGCTPSGPAALA